MLKIIIPTIGGAAVYLILNQILNNKCDKECKIGESVSIGETVNSFPCFGKKYSYIPLLAGSLTIGLGYLVMSKFSKNSKNG